MGRTRLQAVDYLAGFRPHRQPRHLLDVRATGLTSHVPEPFLLRWRRNIQVTKPIVPDDAIPFAAARERMIPVAVHDLAAQRTPIVPTLDHHSKPTLDGDPAQQRL